MFSANKVFISRKLLYNFFLLNVYLPINLKSPFVMAGTFAFFLNLVPFRVIFELFFKSTSLKAPVQSQGNRLTEDTA